LPVLFDVPRPTAFRAGDSLSVQLPPGRYERAQLLSLRLVQENMGRRPVYFALTTGGSADRLGLGTHMLGAGFVRKVMPSPVVATDSIVALQGLGWTDLARARRLLFETYNPGAATRTRPFGWIDTPSENILTLYVVSYQAFSVGARMRWPNNPGALQLADSADAILNAITAQTSFGRSADQTR
jgi:hypothetical protein